MESTIKNTEYIVVYGDVSEIRCAFMSKQVIEHQRGSSHVTLERL